MNFWQKKKSFHVPSLEQSIERPPTKHNCYIFKGLFLGGLSGVFFSSIALLVKYINNLPTAQLVLLRFVSILFLSLPEVAKFRGNIFGPKQHRLTIFIRSIFGTTHILLSYTTFRLLPLGEAAVIILSYPALVAILAKIFLKEPCGIFQGLILVLTIVGITFIAKLPAILEGKTTAYSKETTYGLLAGIGSVVLNTSQIIIVRKLRHIHHVVWMFNLGWIAIIESVIVMSFTGKSAKWQECGMQGLLIILLGLFNYGSQILITLALQGEMAAPVTIMRAGVDILLSFVFQVIVFNDVPDKYSIIGAAILGICFLLSGINKWACG